VYLVVCTFRITIAERDSRSCDTWFLDKEGGSSKLRGLCDDDRFQSEQKRTFGPTGLLPASCCCLIELQHDGAVGKSQQIPESYEHHKSAADAVSPSSGPRVPSWHTVRRSPHRSSAARPRGELFARCGWLFDVGVTTPITSADRQRGTVPYSRVLAGRREPSV
jgi:hypothetical protein